MTQPNLPQSDPQAALDIRAYLRPIWRWKFIVLAITILAAAGTYELTKREPKSYVATTSVYVRNADPTATIGSTGGGSIPPGAQSLEDIATLFTAQNITGSVYQHLHLPVGSAGTVVVTPAATSSFVYVTATSGSPVYAAKLANTYVSVFEASQAASVAAAARSDAKAALAALQIVDSTGGPTKQAERAPLLAQIDQYDTAAGNPDSGLTQIDPAVAPAFPSSPNPKRDAIFAAAIALLLGIALAYLLERFDRRLGRISAVQSQYGQSIVAVLPRLSRAGTLRGRGHGSGSAPPEFLEPMRGLRVNLRLAGRGHAPRSVLITSAVPAEGKSTVARNLAFACADAGDRVLLVDCDLRRPSVARVFDVNPEIGLAQVLRREASPAEATVTVFHTNRSARNGSNGASAAHAEPGDPRAHGSISVMTHGHIVESPGALLSSPAMTNLLAGAMAVYDMVILDTSPILTVSDAVPLLDQVGAVVFVARLGMTTRQAAERLTELSERVPSMNLVGVVVNDVRHRFLDEDYGYAGRYGYAYAKAKG